MRFSEGFAAGTGTAGASGAGSSRTDSPGAGSSWADSPGAGPSWADSPGADSSAGTGGADSSAGTGGASSSWRDPSWTEDTDWTKVPFSGVFAGQVWEGTDQPAPAGPWGVVELSATSELESLTDAVETLERLNELQCWAEAQKARLVDRIRELYELETQPAAECGANATGGASADPGANQDDFVTSLASEEVGALLRLPLGAAKSLVEQCRMLVNHHEPVMASMEAGKLSWRHATTIVDECVGVPADSVTQFEQDLIETAERSTVPKLTRKARGLREILHPEAAPVRKTRAAAERRVILETETDGMAWLSAYLPAEQACGIYNRLDAGARGLQTPEEPRTLTQLRADVFTDLLTHTCAGNIDTGTGFRGIGATVHIAVPALTLLDQLPGADNNDRTDFGSDAHSGGSRPGGEFRSRCEPSAGDPGGTSKQGDYAVLEGYGPIDPKTAARLAGHAPSFTRILTHPEEGTALSIGRTTYRPPKHLQDWVRIRDKTCRHPGCNRAAMATEIDHTTPWHQGGCTSHDNLCCLCKRHHLLKTQGHWDYMQPEPGTIKAISPAGKTYTTRPPPF